MQNLKSRPKRFYLASGLVLVALLLAGSMIVLAFRQQPSGGNVPGRGISAPDYQHYITPHAGGKALYVSPAGKDSNDGSQAQPFATIQKAADVVTPGTIVYVLPGTYLEDVVVKQDGTTNARIAFVSLKQWEAKVKTTNDDVPWTTKGDYIDIIGFDISSDGARDGLVNWGSFTRTIGNRVHDVPGTCDTQGGSGINDTNYSSHDNDIIGNVVFHIGDTYPKMCEFVHAIYHSNARGHIINNIAYNNAGVGINLWHGATATIVSNNLVFDNKEHGISVGTDPDVNDGDDGDHFIVTNNISINNGILGIRERKGVGPHNQFLNNIVYGNGRAAFGDEKYDWPSAVDTKDVGTITSEAMFVAFKDDGSGDYHLQAGSPAIDAGTKIGAPATDFDGNPRPKGKGYDIGPFEAHDTGLFSTRMQPSIGPHLDIADRHIRRGERFSVGNHPNMPTAIPV